MTQGKLYSKIADQVARIIGYKSEIDFYNHKPTLLEKEKFKSLCQDRRELQIEIHKKNLGLNFNV
jgi:hypothetical protein